MNDNINPDQPNDSQNHENNDEIREFEDMLKRWGITVPDKSEDTNYISVENLIAKWSQTKFQRPSQSIQSIRNGTRCIEAVTALFGYCYGFLQPFDTSVEELLEWGRESLENYRTVDYSSVSDKKMMDFCIKSGQERIDTLDDLIAFRNSFLSEKEELFNISESDETGSYIKTMLTAAYTIIKFSGEKRYDAFLDDLLADAYQVVESKKLVIAERFTREQLVNDGRRISGDVEGFLACLANSVICNTYAHVVSELVTEYKRDYIVAFTAFESGLEYWDKLGYDLALPFIGYPLVDAELEKAVKVWEKVKENVPLEKLSELRYRLGRLYDFICDSGEGYSDACVPYEGPADVYFSRQFEFCETLMGHDELRQVLYQLQEQQHQKRMETDFFERLWDALTPETRKDILQGEREWYDGQKVGPEESAFFHYGRALETELHAIIFGNVNVQRCIGQILSERGTKNKLRMTSKKAQTLYLSDMSKLLEYTIEEEKFPEIKPIKAAIDALDVSNEEKRLFSDYKFIQVIKDTYQLRSENAHRERSRINKIGAVSTLRRQILGISCEGYLPKLAMIKRQVFHI